MSKTLLENVVRALNQANLEPLHEAISDDIVWKSASTKRGFFRFGGEYKGQSGVQRQIREFSTDYVIRAIIPKEIISSGDVTWGLFWIDLNYKPTLAQVSFDCAVRWRLRDGKVVEHQAFMDTAAALVQEKDGLLAGP